MVERAEKQRAPLWERLLEIVFVLAVVAGLTVWIVTNRRSETTSPQQKTGLKVVTTAPIRLSLAYVANGLKQVTAMAHPAGDDRLYVTEQPGTIRVIQDGVVQSQPFLDIHDKVENFGEEGLIGLAFDPQFATNRFVYVMYSAAHPSDHIGESILARFTANATTTSADPATQKIILRQSQPFSNHKGGQLAFGPDGLLYVGFGDGGSAGDPSGNGQSLGTWLGKILRIDVHNGDPYAAPSDNPFTKTAGAKPEVWDYGLRNPWRFSFDQSNGSLLIADVGQDKLEEVDVEAAGKGGKNYGWRCYEADKVYNNANCQPASSYVMPRVSYEHEDKRCSITGGYVYHGSRLTGFDGQYVYADYCTGEIWSLDYTDKAAQPQLQAETNFNISTFGMDNDGNIYVADYSDGIIYKLSQSI